MCHLSIDFRRNLELVLPILIILYSFRLEYTLCIKKVLYFKRKRMSDITKTANQASANYPVTLFRICHVVAQILYVSESKRSAAYFVLHKSPRRKYGVSITYGLRTNAFTNTYVRRSVRTRGVQCDSTA